MLLTYYREDKSISMQVASSKSFTTKLPFSVDPEFLCRLGWHASSPPTSRKKEARGEQTSLSRRPQPPQESCRRSAHDCANESLSPLEWQGRRDTIFSSQNGRSVQKIKNGPFF